MKMTNMEMEQHIAEINSIINKEKKIPGEVIYHAIRNKNRMESEIREYIDFRDKLIKTLGEKNESGNYQIDSHCEKFEEFQQEIEKIAVVEVDVEITKIPISKLCDNYSPIIISSLDFMIE